jgi:hypothetical protein
MGKKNVIIWANCQGGSINFMLKKYYFDNYNIHSFMNFEYIRNDKLIPVEFYNADVFIYQNYSDKPNSEYDLSNILNNILPSTCKKICISFLQFDATFCYNENDEQNLKTINTKNPFGKFYFGIDQIINYFKNSNIKNKEETINEVINTLLDENTISQEIIKNTYNKNFDFLEKKLLNSDVPELYYFIKDNFTKISLFHNRNHPTGILLNEQIKLIFNLLKLEYPKLDEEENINILNTMLNDWVMPILPSVRKYYGIDFPDTCSSWYNKEIVDTKTFIEAYVKELYF